MITEATFWIAVNLFHLFKYKGILINILKSMLAFCWSSYLIKIWHQILWLSRHLDTGILSQNLDIVADLLVFVLEGRLVLLVDTGQIGADLHRIHGFLHRAAFAVVYWLYRLVREVVIEAERLSHGIVAWRMLQLGVLILQIHGEDKRRHHLGISISSGLSNVLGLLWVWGGHDEVTFGVSFKWCWNLMIDHHFGSGSLLLDSQVVRTFVIAFMEDAVVLVFLLGPEQELGGSRLTLKHTPHIPSCFETWLLTDFSSHTHMLQHVSTVPSNLCVVVSSKARRKSHC